MNTQGGLVRIILIIIISIIILSIFKVSLKNVFDNQFVKDNFSFVWKGAMYAWNNFLGKPVMYVYNFFKVYIWDSSIDSWQRIKNGVAPKMFNENAPRVLMDATSS